MRVSSLKYQISDINEAIKDEQMELESAHAKFHELRKVGDTDDDTYAHDDVDLLLMTGVERTSITKDLIERHDEKIRVIKLLQQNIQRFHLQELKNR